jgi:hypothetical protein
MTVVDRSLQIPADNVVLDADLMVPGPAGGVVLCPSAAPASSWR